MSKMFSNKQLIVHYLGEERKVPLTAGLLIKMKREFNFDVLRLISIGQPKGKSKEVTYQINYELLTTDVLIGLFYCALAKKDESFEDFSDALDFFEIYEIFKDVMEFIQTNVSVKK